MKNIKKPSPSALLFLLPALMVASPAHASGNGPGNGGEVVAENGKYYLFDLVEAGIHLKAGSLLKTIAPTADSERCVAYTTANRAIDRISDQEVRELIRKPLVDLVCDNNAIAPALILAAQHYEFAIATEKTVSVYTGPSVILRPRELAAIRRGTQVFVRETLWNKMDRANKIGLIFHELLYGMVTPRKAARVPGGAQTYFQDAFEARSMVASLFKGKAHLNPSAKELSHDYKTVIFRSDGKEALLDLSLQLSYNNSVRLDDLDPASTAKEVCDNLGSSNYPEWSWDLITFGSPMTAYFDEYNGRSGLTEWQFRPHMGRPPETLSTLRVKVIGKENCESVLTTAMKNITIPREYR